MTITYRADLGPVLDRRLEEARQRIRQLDAAYLAATAQAAVVDAEMEYIAVEPVAFDFDDILMLHEPRTYQTQGRDSWGDNVRVDITEYTVAVPFTGDAVLIDHKAVGLLGGQFMMTSLQNASIQGSTVDLTIQTQGMNPTAAQQAVQGEINRAKDWLTRQAGFANTYAASWAKHAREVLLQTVVQRQASLETADTVMKALGIPLGKAKAQVPVQRKPKPLRVAQLKATRAQHTETQYALTDSIYDDIVETISALGLAAERLPTTNQKMTEEDLRNAILFVLNANYEGRAVGEAFSGKGKTDILLMWENRAAFIGECKIWHGEKKFLEAVEQLFGYTTWRDVRTALIIFADPLTMTDVQTKARAALRTHAAYSKDSGGDRYVMIHPQDSAKHVTVALLFVAAKLKDN